MKTKRFLALLVSIVMLLSMLPTTALAADNAHSAHSSYVTHVEAVAGNCTKPGNIEFWYCSYYTCEKCYSDEAMTQEISPADVVITPGVHSDACVGCEYSKTEKIFDAFIPAEQPDYDAEYYFWSNGGFHGSFSDRLDGFKFLFVGECDGKLYAMGNETLTDGSRSAVDISEYIGEDGSVVVDSDTVEFFTYENMSDTYIFSPDNGYMSVLDGKLVVHGENLNGIDTSYSVFNQSIRFQQDEDLEDNGRGYLYAWGLNQDIILFDSTGAEPKFVAVPSWSEGVDNRAHNIMLYMERCEHPNMKHTEAADATCTEDGAIEHWYCEDCKLYFANAEASEYIELPEGISDYEQYLTLYATGHEYGDDNYCDNCGEIWHPNAIRMEGVEIDPTCFEPGAGAYWFCEECGMYLDESKENEYWEEVMASKIPALGHAFNADAGKCDHCGLANPVYTKITSLDDINEEDMYIFVAKVGDKYFALGGLDESTGNNEQGVIGCVESGNAVEIVPYDDGSISLLNQNYVGNGIPSEFMLDVNPDQWNFTEMGLTTVMPLLPNYCVYSFQSYDLHNTGYLGVPRYADGMYGMWDGGAWAIDFYTTEVDENTYHDDMDGYTHAEQVARGNIDDNIAEGDLLMYPANYYSIGGAMFTLRFREYVNEDDVTEYYFICGEDWALTGSSGWDSETDTTPTNDTQYAVSLYRYDVPTIDTHTCDFGDWIDDENGRSHTRTCKDPECGKTETESHNWDDGVETKAPTCTETGVKTFTCSDCKATKTEDIPALDHDWGEWTYDSIDFHIRNCKRNCGVEQEMGGHEWGEWTPVDGTTHKMVCDLCKGEQTGEHNWDDGVITKEPTEWEEGVTTYTCVDCSHTKTEPVDKLEHECTWTDWYPNGDENHKRDCMDDNCDKFETLPHGWDAGVITKEPTCKEAGVKTFTCLTCQHTRTEDVPTTDHVFGDWTPNNDGMTHSRYCSCNESETADHKFDEGSVTEKPTHTEKGIKTYTCGDCKYSYTEDIPVLTDHAWGEWVINKLDEANTHIRYCICNESQTAPHNFDEGKVTTEATHTSKGVMTFTCTDGCGYSYTEEISETAGHEWTDWSPNDNGTHTRSCRCNANETNPCEWDDGVVTAPTCEEEGTTVYTCTVCGNTKTDTTPALDHDWSDWTDTGANAVADIHERSCQRDGCNAKETGNHEWSNWTSTGSTEHKKTCSVCKGERTSTHAWDNGEVTKEATVKEPGVTTYACSDCGATKTEVIPKIVCDHTWGKWEAENDETHKHTCANGNGCEAFQRQAHEWNEGVITTEPTETTEGVRTYTCLVCSHTKTESIAMLEHTHSFGSWVSDGEETHTRRCENGNTCTATETEKHTCNAWASNDDGTHSGKCSVCGAEITQAHTWSDWAVQDGGSLKRTCTAECGALEEMPVLQPISYSVVNATSEENAASAELKDNSVALFNSVLTEEEQSAVASGATVSVYLEVQDIPANEVTSSDKAAAEAVITEEDNGLDENTEIGMYLDIELFKEVTDNNTTEETQITETSNKVTITIAIPDELINTNSSVDRTYRIIRVHEDENGNLITDVIEGTFDSNAKTFTFESDKFSTYALAYNDTEKAVQPTTYTITFNANGGSVTPASDGTNAEGKLASLPIPTHSGSYTFNGWYTAASGGTKVTTSTVFTADTTIYAQWTYTGGSGIVIPTVFSVTVKDSDNGEVKVNATYSVPGSIVKLTVTPDEGYELDDLTVKNGNKEVATTLKDGKYQFTMPYASVTVTATFKKIETPVVPDPVVPSFDDVAEDTYYFDAVLWAVENGITTGTSDTTFSPDMTCTRAQAVTFLWRAAGSPEPKSNVMPFEDIAVEAYYYKAVLWAVENGITNGTSGTAFSPDAECTRAQIVTFLWRAQKSPAITAVKPFADIAADAYYFDAVLWAVGEKITNGTSETTFSPAAECTRAQIVTFLYRAMGDEK